MAKKKASGDYFGLSRLISLILVIIPITSLVCGILARIKDGKLVAALLRLVLGWNIIWICDVVLMIWKHHILRLINV